MQEPSLIEIHLTIAEFMGYSEQIEVSKARSLKTAQTWYAAFKVAPPRAGFGEYSMYVDREGNKIYCAKPHSIFFPPSYTMSLSEMFKVEAELEKRGLHRDYVVALYKGVLHPWQQTDKGYYPDSMDGELECDFVLIHTTAKQRAQAAYRVIKAQQEATNGTND